MNISDLMARGMPVGEIRTISQADKRVDDLFCELNKPWPRIDLDLNSLLPSFQASFQERVSTLARDSIREEVEEVKE